MNRLLTAACAVAALAIPSAALAQHTSGGGHGGSHGSGHGGHGSFSPSFRGGGGHGGAHFAAGSISHFSSFQMGAWRGGHWFHGGFGSRFGWWWWADGFWYLYDSPIYPYPGYVADYYVPQTGGSWYYCDNPAGYYPYVRSCPGPWRAVAPTPPQGGAPGGPGLGYGEGAPPPADAQAAPQGAPPPQDGQAPQDGDGQQQPQDDQQSQPQA
jgi:hypothetical protein